MGSDASTTPTPTTRWADERGAEGAAAYVARMRELAAEGSDLDGEARFVDVLLPRRARVLDGGCGTGRVGAGLHARGHSVVGIDADPLLVEAARADHQGPTWLVGDLARLDPAAGTYDAVVAAGNVMVYLAPGSETAVVSSLAHVLAAGGVLVTGFATSGDYGPDALDADAAAAGLTLEHRFATWDMRPWHPTAGWVVSVHRRA